MNTPAAETVALLTLLIRAMVTDREAVCIQTFHRTGVNITFEIRVSDEETGKLIGKGGQTVRSLRSVLHCIGKEHHANYDLYIVQPGEVKRTDVTVLRRPDVRGG